MSLVAIDQSTLFGGKIIIFRTDIYGEEKLNGTCVVDDLF
jgi:hypothetical protein